MMRGMPRWNEPPALIEIRASVEADCEALAALHRDAWRYAYAGIIPGVALERMIARRGSGWWRRLHRGGGQALVVALDRDLAGYATLGRGRMPGRPVSGEIYELYLRPEFQGVGLGRRLFSAARLRLADAGFARITVWSLAENAIGCRFYRAMGGKECGRAQERIGGARLEKVGFAWS
jgi:ribosomal protein S18 acetylase RimI-like enzyme